MIELYLNGKINEAAKKHIKLFKLFRAMFVNSNPIPLKYAMKAKGWDIYNFRPPLYELKEEKEIDYMNNVLNEYKLI
jgi:4-hydroxy-tetrahydrodipicolinate synthase